MTKCTTIPVKSCGLCLAFLLSIFTIPTFADDQTLGDDPQCDNATLHTTTGSVTISAKWKENTIILDWQPGEDAEFTRPEQNDNAYSCTYNGGITLPTAPTRSGYTFGGWRVGAAAAQCVLSQYLPENNGISYGYINDRTGLYGTDSRNANQYELTEDNTWATEFTEGTIKGRALCSSTNSTWATTGTPNETGGGQYCWCAGTDFGNSCHVASPSWVFDDNLGDSDDCANDCAFYCAKDVDDNSAFRRAVFGVTE